MEEIVNYLVNTIGEWGYWGIFLLMFLESSFFPFPSEVVMVPAGYLISQGEMEFPLVIGAGVGGSVAGAWFNYLIALYLGRKPVERLIKRERLEKLEKFFTSHGPISTFTGRLLPGVRQYISFPAGLGRMEPVKFTLYTALGAGIWVTILTLLGYFIGENKELIHRYLREITIGVVGVVAIIIGVYIWWHRKKGEKSTEKGEK